MKPLRSRVRSQVRNLVWDQVVDRVRDQAWRQVLDQVRDRVQWRVWSRVWNQTRDQVSWQVWGAAMKPLRPSDESESSLMRRLQARASELGARLFRNQVGEGELRGRWIKYGLCVGSSDLIGWTRDGRFLAIEVKKPRRGAKTTSQQKQFIDAVTKAGGVAGIVRSIEELDALLGGIND